MSAKDIKRVLIVGAGTMGHSIAQVYAQGGIDVNLVDTSQERLDHAVDLIKFNLDTLVEFGKLSNEQISAVVSRIHPSTDLEVSAKGVGLVVEAVNEVPEVKEKVFSQLNDFCAEDTILASNTSTLDVFKITKKVVKSPERLMIQHWFAPPHIIPLVEIVPGRKTSKEVVETSVKLLEKLGKKPVVLQKFSEAFIVNAIQNAIGGIVFSLLLRKIATPESIDTAIKHSLGIRLPIVGVVQTLDFTGLDLVSDILKSKGLGVSIIDEKVEKGHLGAKSGKGLYDYSGKSEKEILKKRDGLYLKMLDHLEKSNAFEPV